jgi:hypothetical protein
MTTLNFSSSVGRWTYYITTPSSYYIAASAKQSVTYNLSYDTTTPDPTDFVSAASSTISSFPVWLTVQIIPVSQPSFKVDISSTNTISSWDESDPATPPAPITVAKYLITQANITQSISYPAKSFTEILTSITNTGSAINVAVNGYGWYLPISTSLSQVPSTSTTIYFANTTSYDFEIDIYGVNCTNPSTSTPCVTSVQNNQNIFASGTNTLTNFRVSAGVLYPFNMSGDINSLTNVGIVLSGLGAIGLYTFTLPLLSETFKQNDIFDTTGKFVCSFSYIYTVITNTLVISMFVPSSL